MPIVVQHQPSFVGVGQTAFRAGYGQFQQQQFQNSMAVMQMALQERARQQALANQQQAAYLGAQQDAADRQSRERMFLLQQSNQAAMNDADNRSRMQMELWQGQQQAQNYADLRDHQMQLAEFKAATSSAEYDKKSRMEALGGIASGLTTRGQQLATQMRTELGIITSRRASGKTNDEQYQSELAAWDEKFGAEGDWAQHRANPAAQAQGALEATQYNHPQWGKGRIVTTKEKGAFFVPDQPVFTEINGMKMIGIPDQNVGIKWEVVQQPKTEKPKSSGKPPFSPADVQKKAEELADMYPGFSPQSFIDSGVVTDELNKLLIPGVSAPAEGEGEFTADGDAQQQQQPAPQQQQPGQQPPAQQPQPQEAMGANEPPPSVKGEQERGVWQNMATLPKFKPHLTQDAKDIQLLLSSGLPITDPQVSSKITALSQKINDETKKKGINPQKTQQQQQGSGVSDEMTAGKPPSETIQKQSWEASQDERFAEIERLNGESVPDLIEFAFTVQDDNGATELSKIRSEYESGLINASQAAVRLTDVAKRNPARYAKFKQARLSQKIDDETKKNGIAPQQSQQQQQETGSTGSGGMTGVVQAYLDMGGSIPARDLSPFIGSLPAGNPIKEAFFTLRRDTEKSPQQKAEELKQLLDQNMALYTAWKQKQAKP